MLIVGFGEPTISRTWVQLWYNRFKEGREDVNDDARPGRPSTSTTDENCEAVKKIILNNRQIPIGEVAGDVGILFGSCQVILTVVLGMKRATAKIVPKLLNLEQKQRAHGHRSGNVDDVQRSIKCEGFAHYSLRFHWHGASWILTTRLYGQ